MSGLREMALNGMGLGTKSDDITKLYNDRKAAGAKLEAEILLNIGVTLMDLESAERQADLAARNLRSALERFSENPSVTNAEWLTHYAKGVETHSRQAQAAYSEIGKMWALYNISQA